MAQFSILSILVLFLLASAIVFHVVAFIENFWYTGRNGMMGLWKYCVKGMPGHPTLCYADMKNRSGRHFLNLYSLPDL